VPQPLLLQNKSGIVLYPLRLLVKTPRNKNPK